ncbi:MIT domain-containing protein 1 [Phlebotomus argentipes]|uniref:MIT domain-containing protein 1 n=1 Tax=Phlebotomus argentipes TaxID=94469 RepID=UPI0028936AC3|nr:MIT domain-containing protein 1 [Phlebotomus argentipes]
MSAVELLKKAVEFDEAGRHMEAMKLYEEGAEGLATIAKNESNAAAKTHYETKVREYRDRAKILKEKYVRMSSKGEIKDKIHIVEDSMGHSYQSLFGKYLNDVVEEITVEEPYLREHFQLTNLVMFCELAVTSCRNLKFINVTTCPTEGVDQIDAFKQLKDSLKRTRGINLSVEFSKTTHDRQIILSNGYIIKIGRGLNYFKRAEKYSLGIYNFDFRECRETNVDIFFCPENIK